MGRETNRGPQRANGGPGHRHTERAVHRISSTILAVANLNDPEFDEHREHPGFHCRRARLGRQVGAQRLGLSLWEIPPGQAAYPYHYHLGEEELIVILSGQLSLRGSQGWRELQEGEIVSFPVGEAGAHQIVNRSDEPARMLAFSTSGAPDVVIRPQSGTIGVFERRPEGGGLYSHFRADDAVSYFEGEPPSQRRRTALDEAGRRAHRLMLAPGRRRRSRRVRPPRRSRM